MMKFWPNSKTLKGAALLEGFRGSPPLDLEAIVRIVRAIGRLLIDEPSIREIESQSGRPLPARRRGGRALDALMIAPGRSSVRCGVSPSRRSRWKICLRRGPSRLKRAYWGWHLG